MNGMELIRKQIDDLRDYAKSRNGDLARIINDAADTIESLSEKLSARNMECPLERKGRWWICFSRSVWACSLGSFLRQCCSVCFRWVNHEQGESEGGAVSWDSIRIRRSKRSVRSMREL